MVFLIFNRFMYFAVITHASHNCVQGLHKTVCICIHVLCCNSMASSLESLLLGLIFRDLMLSTCFIKNLNWQEKGEDTNSRTEDTITSFNEPPSSFYVQLEE